MFSDVGQAHTHVFDNNKKISALIFLPEHVGHLRKASSLQPLYPSPLLSSSLSSLLRWAAALRGALRKLGTLVVAE